MKVKELFPVLKDKMENGCSEEEVWVKGPDGPGQEFGMGITRVYTDFGSVALWIGK